MKRTIFALAAALMTSSLALAAGGGNGSGNSTSALDIETMQALTEQNATAQSHALDANQLRGADDAAPKPIVENSRDFNGNR